MGVESRYWWLNVARIALAVLAVMLSIGAAVEAARLVVFRDPVSRHHTRLGWALVSVGVGGLWSVVLAGLAQAITLLFNVRNHQLGARQTDLGPLSGLAARTAALRQLRD